MGFDPVEIRPSTGFAPKGIRPHGICPNWKFDPNDDPTKLRVKLYQDHIHTLVYQVHVQGNLEAKIFMHFD